MFSGYFLLKKANCSNFVFDRFFIFNKKEPIVVNFSIIDEIKLCFIYDIPNTHGMIFLFINVIFALHKKWSFLLKISLVNVTKSAGNFFIFCAMNSAIHSWLTWWNKFEKISLATDNGSNRTLVLMVGVVET